MSVKNRIRSLLARKPVKKWKAEPSELPWFDQPNALDLLADRRRRENLSDEDYAMLQKYATDGYCVVSGMIGDADLNSMNRDLDDLWTATEPLDGLNFYDVRLGPNDTPISMTHAELLQVDLAKRLKARDIPNWRINHFDAYSEGAKTIYHNAELIRLTSLIFDRPSEPDTTLNFMYGSSQDAHQDTAVFHIFPPNYIIGAWIACEDISPDCGPLMYYPGSHRERIYKKFNNYPQTNLRTVDAKTIQDYQDYVDNLCLKYERHVFIAKKGETLLWHGMLLHGGSEIKNPKLTRRSYVIHYVPPRMNVGNDVEGPFNF